MSVTRQQLRALGREQARQLMKQELPGISRRVRRRLALLAANRSWKNRDVEVVEKAKHAKR
jgi:hypothetical protein